MYPFDNFYAPNIFLIKHIVITPSVCLFIHPECPFASCLGHISYINVGRNSKYGCILGQCGVT